MKVRFFFVLSSIVSLALLVATMPAKALGTAVQSRPVTFLAPTLTSGPASLAAVSSSAPVVRTGNAGQLVGKAYPQVRDDNSHTHLEPSEACEVSGIIDTDTTWGPAECDPYIVTGSVSVQPGAT